MTGTNPSLHTHQARPFDEGELRALWDNATPEARAEALGILRAAEAARKGGAQ